MITFPFTDFQANKRDEKQKCRRKVNGIDTSFSYLDQNSALFSTAALAETSSYCRTGFDSDRNISVSVKIIKN